ncbi:ADP-ribosyltransferase [Streptomyces thermoviolaceus]|nr:ADP-ribosyltransferase [Streptomyces thermoviolaceus]
MIKPEEIPQFTGDLDALERDCAALTKDAGHIRGTGSDVHSRFQGLSAYYKAPEAEQLFATTVPVKDRAGAFADDLQKVSGALSGYATEVRPLVKKLEDLKREAVAFVDSVKDDDEWEYDGDKVDEHNRIRDEITQTVAAFWAAERTCHNKITALWHGTQMVAGDGSEKKNQYGFNAEDLKNAKVPWGEPVEEKHHAWEIGHWVKSFVWDGLIVDGVWGTIKGLGTLVGFGGWEAMGQAWKGLAQLATGIALTAVPGVGAAFWTLPDDKLPSWIRDSRTAMKETGKALVAWDEWGKNPARAAGAVTFNVLTTVFTGGAGGAAAGAGKAGAAARAISLAGKAGHFIDPMTYIAKGAGAGLSKIGDITKGLRGVGNIDIPTLPDNAVHLPQNTIPLPNGHFVDPQGNFVTPNGTVETTPVLHQPAAPQLPEGWTIQGQQAAYASFPSGAGNGVHGGIPHTVDSGASYGMPTTSHGIQGGIPHNPTGPVHAGPTHVAADGMYGGTSHGTYGGTSYGPGNSYPPAAHYDTTPPASYQHTPAGTPTHDVQSGPWYNPHDTTVPGPHGGAHDFPGSSAGHETPTGHGDGSHGPGHDGHHAGHDSTGHADQHPNGHAGDDLHVDDTADFGDTVVDATAHHGVDTPTVPGHEGTDVPVPGSEAPFEYKPHMSQEQFDALSVEEQHAVATAELAHGTNPVPSSSNKAGLDYGNAVWKDFIDSLPAEKKAGLVTYTGAAYDPINNHLRYGTEAPQHILDTIKSMDEVMDSYPVPEDIMVVRGTGIDHLKLESPLEMQGGVFDDLAYTSTAIGKTPPEPFNHKPVWLHLRVPKGTPALWLEPLTQVKGERELLLARGSAYKVTRVFADESGKWHVYGEILPRS